MYAPLCNKRVVIVNLMIEIWKDIKGYKGLYQVSNLGRVKSLERKSDVDGRLIKSKILKTGLNNPGYKFLVLRKNGISKNRMIHRLVAEALYLILITIIVLIILMEINKTIELKT